MIEDLNLNPEEVILGQGTLRPDLIESASGLASGQADVIKTHHNDTELVRKLRDQNRVVEPLAEFHKDEVRRECRKDQNHLTSNKIKFCSFFDYEIVSLNIIKNSNFLLGKFGS